MSNPANKGTVGPWAREKLDALGQYLNYYTTVLKNQGRWLRGTIYVDAFAGPGVSRVRRKATAPQAASLFEPASTDPAQVEYLKGSPRVALDIANPFGSYVFIERDPDRIKELNALADEYAGKRTIEVKQGDATAGLQTWLTSGIHWRTHRAVVFLDPFGMHVPWSIIEELAKTKAIEVIINFPLAMAIQRFLTKSGEISERFQADLDAFFG